MRIHHRQMSDLIKQYAAATPEADAAVRAVVRSWRIEVMAGNPVTMPGMPGGTLSELADFDYWRVRRFPRLYKPSDS